MLPIVPNLNPDGVLAQVYFKQILRYHIPWEYNPEGGKLRERGVKDQKESKYKKHFTKLAPSSQQDVLVSQNISRKSGMKR